MLKMTVWTTNIVLAFSNVKHPEFGLLNTSGEYGHPDELLFDFRLCCRKVYRRFQSSPLHQLLLSELPHQPPRVLHLLQGAISTWWVSNLTEKLKHTSGNFDKIYKLLNCFNSTKRFYNRNPLTVTGDGVWVPVATQFICKFIAFI